MMDSNLINQLKAVDTPTIANAIEVAQGSRDFTRFTRGTMVAAGNSSARIVGRARTARVRAERPSLADGIRVRQVREDYYRHMASGEGPSVAVIEDLDYPDVCGAWWGEVNSTVHRALGMSGAITNGSVRDLDELDARFLILASQIGVSHAHVHPVDFGGPVTVMGLKVLDGDFVHADCHGALVIPEEIISHLPAAITRMQDAEAKILGPARDDADYTVDRLVTSWNEADALMKG